MPKNNKLCTRVRKYIFNYKVDSDKTDKPYSSHSDYSDMMSDSFILQPKFKFIRLMNFTNFLTTYRKINL